MFPSASHFRASSQLLGLPQAQGLRVTYDPLDAGNISPAAGISGEPINRKWFFVTGAICKPPSVPFRPPVAKRGRS